MPFSPSFPLKNDLILLFCRYDPIVADDFIENIVKPIYSVSGYANLNAIHPHRISVFFILLATGALYDNHPSSTVVAEQYHALSRAAFSLESILSEATLAAVQALFMMIRYIYASDRTSSETRWLLTGLCCRIAQTVCHEWSALSKIDIVMDATTDRTS